MAPEYFSRFDDSTKDLICEMFHDPALWSEDVVGKIIKRYGVTTSSIQEVQPLMKGYLNTLCDEIRRNAPKRVYLAG
jgi:hypothetical protein